MNKVSPNSVLLEIPHQDDDPIMRLLVHYFEPTDLMHVNYNKLEDERKRKGKLSYKKEKDSFMFFRLWLATLFVLVEAFQHRVVVSHLKKWREAFPEINMCCSSIEHMANQLGNELKGLRNDTFHFNPKPTFTVKFLTSEDRDPLRWAEALHSEFKQLYSAYRIERAFIELVKER